MHTWGHAREVGLSPTSPTRAPVHFLTVANCLQTDAQLLTLLCCAQAHSLAMEFQTKTVKIVAAALGLFAAALVLFAWAGRHQGLQVRQVVLQARPVQCSGLRLSCSLISEAVSTG